jgi:hypothetical protein
MSNRYKKNKNHEQYIFILSTSTLLVAVSAKYLSVFKEKTINAVNKTIPTT